MVYLNPSDGILYGKVEKQWRLSISLFQAIPNKKCIRQILAYLDSAIINLWTHFYWTYQFHRDNKLIENIIKGLHPNWIIGFLKSINSWSTASLYSHFYSSIWGMQNVWSAVELLCRNPHWWSLVISSAYRVSFDSRMLDTILCVVDRSDMPV